MRKWVLKAERNRREIANREIEELVKFSKGIMYLIGGFSLACLAVVTLAAVFVK